MVLDGWQYGLGLDPSLSGTGLILARFRRTTGGVMHWPKPIDFEVLLGGTFAAPDPHRQENKVKVPRPAPERFHRLYKRVSDYLLDTILPSLFAHDEQPLRFLHVAFEDPADFIPRSRGRAGVHTATMLGAAFGVVGHAVVESLERQHNLTYMVHTYGTQQWMPKTKTGRGGWTHTMKHEHTLALIRGQGYNLKGRTEDEVMATGVLLHHWRVLGFHQPRAPKSEVPDGVV